MNYSDLIDNSCCKDCKHRVSRVISAVGLHLEDDNGQPIEFDAETTEIRSEICGLLSIDLDHTVLTCSAYVSKYNNKKVLFKGDKFTLT